MTSQTGLPQLVRQTASFAVSTIFFALRATQSQHCRTALRTLSRKESKFLTMESVTPAMPPFQRVSDFTASLICAGASLSVF